MSVTRAILVLQGDLVMVRTYIDIALKGCNVLGARSTLEISTHRILPYIVFIPEKRVIHAKRYD